MAYLKQLGVERTSPSPPEHAAIRAAEPPSPLSESLRSKQAFAQAVSTQASAAKPIPAPVSSDTLFGDLSAAPVKIQRSSETFEEIWADVGDCTRCPLYQKRTNIVHTDGNRNARLMFVGEAPGADEDIQARPVCGACGTASDQDH